MTNLLKNNAINGVGEVVAELVELLNVGLHIFSWRNSMGYVLYPVDPALEWLVLPCVFSHLIPSDYSNPTQCHGYCHN